MVRLTNKQLKTIIENFIHEAGAVSPDILQYFTDLHIVHDDLDTMDPHEAYGIGYLKAKDNCDNLDAIDDDEANDYNETIRTK